MDRYIYESYIKRIHKFPLLSAEREKELAHNIKNGDLRSRQELINANLRLVVSIAFKYAVPTIPAMDIIQEGNLGLMAAAEKFDPAFNTRFSTYAYIWIVQYINRYIRLKDTAIPLPAMKEELVRAVTSASEELRRHFRREPTVRELAVFLNMKESDVQKALHYKYAFVSLDEKVNSSSETTFSDLLTDSTASPETTVLDGIARQECENLIRRLPARERFVLLNKYRASVNREKVTLHQLGRKLGVSTEAVRQIELRGRAKMRMVLSGCEVLQNA